MKKISFMMIIANLFMFWGEQPPLILGVALAFAMLSLGEVFLSNKWLRMAVSTVLMVIAVMVIRLNFTPMVSAESVIAFILFLASLKLFELKTETDFFHLFLILNLELSGLLILTPTFLMLVYVLFQLGLSFYFVLKLNQGFIKQLNMKRMMFFFAPAIPMGFLFFFLFPRFTSGFNQTANLSEAQSGYSDRIDLDLLRPINLSTQSVFKAKFVPGTVIQPRELYWRGSVLWETDGMHWTPGNFALLNRQHLPDLKLTGTLLQYEIFLEPGLRGPIFLLDFPQKVDLPLENYRQFLDGTYEFKHPMLFKNRLNAKSILNANNELFNDFMKRKSLRVKRYNKETLDPYLKKIYGEKVISVEEKVKRLNDFFRNNDFQYTLAPPSYSSMEEFLSKKEGYCSHFAAVYAFLARLGGIPARVISGFQGGEYNSFGDYYRVEAKDAHAWVEVYLSQTGWSRIDPTEFVNPGRIIYGARILNEQMAPYYELGGLQLEKKWFSFRTLDTVMKYIDYLNGALSLFFYDFDHEYQKLLSEKFNLNRRYLGVYAASSLVFFMFCAYFIMQFLNRGKKIDRALKDYQKLLLELEKKGLPKESHEGPLSFSIRVKEKFPENSEMFLRIDRFIEARYGRKN